MPGPEETAEQRVRGVFTAAYGTAPVAVWSAPGRVNLIGEHTDYNDGFVLPFAIDARTAVAVGPATGTGWRARSEQSDATVGFADADVTTVGAVTGWTAYVAAIGWALRAAGAAIPAVDVAVCSDVPQGAGLSSSAALECATVAALVDLCGVDLPRDGWPALAQRAENRYVGMPCGIMDQSAATLCREGHALFLDCRSMATEHVPFAPAAHGLAMLIVDTRAPHRLVDGEYAARRATCEAAAAALGLPALRDVADLGALAALGDPVMARRARHIVTEDDRVLRTVALLREGRVGEIGPLLTASHESLRVDFEVSVAELDTAVEAALRAGALGARMTGAGFGGCVIALVPAERTAAVADAVTEAFAAKGYAAPAAFTATAAGGARRA